MSKTPVRVSRAHNRRRDLLKQLAGEFASLEANAKSVADQYRAMLDTLIAAGFPIRIPSDSLPPPWQVADIIVKHCRKGRKA